MLFGRVTRITFDIAGTLVVLLVIGAGVLGWRLSLGPLSLKFMTPLIERALSDEAGAVTVVIDDTVLEWGGGVHNIDLRIRGVRVLGGDGHLMLELPDVAMSFSARAALRGLVAPTSLAAIGPEIVLRHGADQSWNFHAGAGQEDDSAAAVSLLLDDLLQPPNPRSPLGYLQSISIFRGSVTVVDEAGGRTVVTRDVTATVGRDAGGLRGRLSAVADLSGSSATLTAAGRYAAADGTFDGALDFAKLDPSALAATSPELAPLAGLHVPLAGRISATVDSSFRMVRGDFEINGTNGRLDAAPYNLPRAAVVRRLHVKGKLPGGSAAVDVDDAELDLNGPTVSLRAHLAGLDGVPRASGVVVARDVPVDELRDLWPSGVGKNARAWIIENLSRGSVGEARAEFSVTRSGGSPAWTADRFAGSMRVAGVEVNYIPRMPHVQGVDGEATFTRNRFDITVAGGHLGGLRLTQGKIELTALDTDNETAHIDVQVEGSLREALELVDLEPLGYLKKIDLAPEAFSGDESLDLDLVFPLKKTLKVDDVQAVATAEVRNLTDKEAALGQDITAGDVKLRVDREGMNIAGLVTLGPARANIDVRRNFSERAPVIGRTQARSRLAGGDLARFGFDLAPFVDGPTDIALDYVERRDGRNNVTVDAKLNDSTLTISQIDWQKPPGPPASAHLVLDLSDGRPKAIPTLTVSAGDPANGGLQAQGRVDFESDGKTIARLAFDTLKAGLTDAHGAWVRTPAGVSIDVAGPSLLVGPMMKGDSEPRSPERPPLALNVEVGRLYFEPDRSLSEVKFRGRRGPERWQSADLVARTDDVSQNGNQVVLTLQDFGDRQKLDMVADDAGAFLKAVDVTPNVSGGRLVISGETDAARPGRPLAGHLHIDEYRVTKAPILARVLSVALLTGIVDALTGQGIRFAQLDADFLYDGGKIEILTARSAGPSLGVTARGVIDSDADTMDLTGTIVPANALNSLPGKIPIIGDLFTGGGGGVFAANYRLAGPMSDPKPSVNPLSTLAPSFLRRLFRPLPGISATDSTPESEKELEREQPAKPDAPAMSPR